MKECRSDELNLHSSRDRWHTGVMMIGSSFVISNRPPFSVPDLMLLRYALSHRTSVLWAAWLQAIGPAPITCFALMLVALSGAGRQVAGPLTVFGAGVLMTTRLIAAKFSGER